MEIGIGLDWSLNLTWDQQAELSREAASLGYTSIWTPESTGTDAFHLCAQRWSASRDVTPEGLDTGIAVSPVMYRSPLAFARALFRERGSLPMLVTALCWSLTIVVDKLATMHAGFGIHGALLNAGIGLFGLGLLGARGRLAELRALREAWKPWLFAITMGAVGLGTQLVAVQHLFTALVEAGKRAIGVTMSVVVGKLVFGEAIDRFKVAAVVLMSVGAGLIVWR